MYSNDLSTLSMILKLLISRYLVSFSGRYLNLRYLPKLFSRHFSYIDSNSPNLECFSVRYSLKLRVSNYPSRSWCLERTRICPFLCFTAFSQILILIGSSCEVLI